jgi:TolB-like protein
MLDVAGGKIMWGKSFDSRVSAAFAVQDSISAEIVKGVEEYYAAN